MEWFLAIDVGAAIVMLMFWYFWFARYNRRRALVVLHWVQTACAGKGRVLKVRWQGTSRLLAELRFPPHMFDHARVVVRLLPRPVPTNWALSRWRKQKETLSFEADLELEGVSGGPVHAIFIRAPWVADHGPEVEVLGQVDGHPVAIRQGNLLAVSFHPELSGETRLHRLLLSTNGGV